MLGMLLPGSPAGCAANGIVGEAYRSIEIMRLNRKNKVFVAIDTQDCFFLKAHGRTSKLFIQNQLFCV
jgi:hypothetical protein